VGLAQWLEADKGLELARSNVVDGVALLHLGSLVDGWGQESAWEAVNVGESDIETRALHIITTKVKVDWSDLPVVLVAKVLVELAVLPADFIAFSVSWNFRPVAQEVSWPGWVGLLPDERRNVNIDDGDEDFLDVGLQSIATKLSDLVAEAWESQERRVWGSGRVLVDDWDIEEAVLLGVGGESLTVADLVLLAVLRVSRVIVVVEVDESVSFSWNVDEGENVVALVDLVIREAQSEFDWRPAS